MGIFGYILALVLLSLSGFFFLKIFYNSEEKFFYKLEFFTLSFLTGVILVPFFIFLTGWIGIKLNFLNIFILIIALNLILFLINLILKTKIQFENFNPISELKKINLSYKIGILFGTLFIILKLSLGGIDILNVPTYQDDSFGNWNYRGKVFFEREELILDKKDGDFLGGGYLQYPMTVSLSKTYFAKFYGKWSEGVVNSLSFLFYLSSILLLFFTIFRETKEFKWGFLSVLLLIGIPLYHIHGTSPYFDLMQGLFLFIPIYFLFKYLENSEKNNNLFYLSIIFIGFLGLTKNEGLSMYLPIMIFSLAGIVFIKKILLKEELNLKIKKLIKSFSALLLPIIFLIFKNIYELGFGNGNNKISEYPIQYSEQAMKTIKFAIFSEGNFNLLGIFILFLIGFFILKNLKKIKENIGIFVLILFFLGFIFIDISILTFVKTLHKEAISQIGVNRIFIHITLLGIFITTILSFKILNKKGI